MPVTVVGTPQQYNSVGNEAGASVDIDIGSGADRALIIAATNNNDARTFNTPTFNGSSVGITLVGDVGNGRRCAMWVMVNPATGVGQTVEVTSVGGNTRLGLYVQELNGVDQSVPFDTPVTSSVSIATPLVTAVTIPADGLGFDIAKMDGTSAWVSDTTGVFVATTNGTHGFSYLLTSGAQTMGYSGWGGTQNIGHIIAPVRPSAGAGSAIPAILAGRQEVL